MALLNHASVRPCGGHGSALARQLSKTNRPGQAWRSPLSSPPGLYRVSRLRRPQPRRPLQASAAPGGRLGGAGCLQGGPRASPVAAVAHRTLTYPLARTLHPGPMQCLPTAARAACATWPTSRAAAASCLWCVGGARGCGAVCPPCAATVPSPCWRGPPHHGVAPPCGRSKRLPCRCAGGHKRPDAGGAAGRRLAAGRGRGPAHRPRGFAGAGAAGKEEAARCTQVGWARWRQSGRMRRTGQGMYVKGGGREPPTGCRLGALACAVQPASLASDRLTGRQTVGCRALSPDAIVIEGGRAVGRVLVDLSAGQVRSVQALQRLHRPLAESVRALAAVQQDVQLPALHAADQHPTRCTPAPNNLPPCSACLPSRAVPTPRVTQRQSYTLAAAAAPSQPQTSTAWTPRSCSCCRVGLLSKLGGGCCSQETW